MRRFKVILFIGLAVVALQGCKGSKDAAKVDSRYVRKPIVETTEDRLKVENLLVEAVMQQEAGNNEEAMRIYKKAIAEDAQCAAAYYELSKMMSENGRLDSAMVYGERAAKISPENVWYKLQLTQLYRLMGNASALVATWEQIVKQNPEVLEYYYELSNAYLVSNNVPKAVEALNRVEKMVGVTEAVSLQKQRLWNAVGKPEKGIKEIEALANAMPREKKYSAILAESCMKQKDYAKAQRYYEQALAADPNDPYLHISMATFYKETKQQDKAYEELKAGFASAEIPTSAKVQILASFYTDQEFYGSCSQYSFALLEDIMARSEDSVSYALFYGDVLMRQEKYAEAVRQFKIALENDSSQYEVWEALLVCESEIDGNEEEMLDYAQRAQRLFPLHSLPYYLQGFMAFQHGHNEEALEKLRQCEKLGFNKGYLEAETYGLMAQTFYRLERSEEAFDYFERYVRLVPNDWGVMNNYAYYLAEQNRDLVKAEQMSKKTIVAEPENGTFLDTYAWILHKMGRDAEALPYIEKAVKSEKTPSETLKNHLQAIKEGTSKH